MADTENLRRMIYAFGFHSRPSSASGSTPCTVADINRVIDNLQKVLYAMVEEMEESE